MSSPDTDPAPGPERAPAPERGTFRALRVRNFRLYASANLVSNTGTWMQRVGQDWLVLQLSGDSGVALGIASALQFAPTLLLSPYGGVLADRYSKRRLLQITQTLMGLLALGLALLVVTDAIALWHVYVFAGVLGAVSAVDVPFRQSFLPEMVGPDLLTNAISLNSATFNLARLIGPSVAGLLIGAASGNAAPAFFVNAASFAFTLASLARMRPGELRPSDRVARGRGQLREGIAYTRARPDLMFGMFLALVVGTFGFNSQVTTALMARQEFGLGAEAFGLLFTCFAVGSLAGALLGTRRSVRPRRRFLLGCTVAFGVLTIVGALMPGVVAFGALLVPTGAAALVFSNASNSFMQLGVDPQMRGRVMALYFMCFMGGTPLGAPLIGWMSQEFGARWGLILGGVVCVVSAIAAALFLGRGRRVHLETRPASRRVRLRISERRPAITSSRLRAPEETAPEETVGEETVAERAPGH